MSETEGELSPISDDESSSASVELDPREVQAPIASNQQQQPTIDQSRTSTSIFNYLSLLVVILLAVLVNSRIDILTGKTASELVADKLGSIPVVAASPSVVVKSESRKPKYVLYNAHGRKDHLRHVEVVLRRFGYEEAEFNASAPTDDWSLMWAHDYPFNAIKTIDFKNLKPCQRVNHVPGCGFITNKVDLSTTRLKYIPRAFKMAQQRQELMEFAAENKEVMFVHKHNQHRHIQVRKLEDINFEDTNNFVQEFIGNPLLVDGFKFDIGVYTIITSVDPLRVHYYSGDILFRFCPTKYHPFDPDNVDKYIVGDDYLPIWKVPSLSQYYNTQRHGMRDSFNLYMKAKGRDPQVIWDQIEESIRLMMYEKEKHLIDILKRYKDKRNFFELMRIDFVVNDDLRVYMMEANMSPNLSAAHFPPNQLLYEQVLYNTLKMARVAFPQQNGTCTSAPSVDQMMASNKNIVVNGELCSKAPCSETCAPVACELCYSCLSETEKQVLFDSVSEHLSRGDTKRVVPAPVKTLKSLSNADWEGMSANNRFMARWFVAKCEADPSSWC